MALKATSAFNDVKVYNCTGGRTLPEWYEDFRKKKVTSLRYNTDFRNRIDLLQDFEFPSASTCISMSKDKRYIGATGTYKPQIKVFDTQQLGLKFERHLDAEAVKFQFLAEDFTKILVMRNDRVVEIHASYGRHHQVRLPKFGRDMCYDDTSCDAVLVGQGNEAWRLNLEEGRFMSPLVTDLPSINKVASNPMHQLLAFGGEDGQLEFWDPRDRTRAGKLDLVKTAGAINKALSAKLSAKGCDVTSVAYDEDGLGLAVGTSSGHVLLYDLRNNAPTIWKDHRYGLPIVDVQFHGTSRNMISSDAKIIKMWNKTSGDAFTSIEPPAAVNDVCVDSGVIMVANEQHRMQAYYCPELGPAPTWAHFLDNLTEELEEQGETPLYDDYKFVTRDELEDWGMSHLIGSNLLRAYMQGFFMDLRLYNRVKTASEPHAYEKYVQNQVTSKIDAKRANRITVSKRLPGVNKDLAQLLLNQPKQKRELQDFDGDGQADKAQGMISNPLGDDRFGDMFTRPEYQIDTESFEFQRLNPNKNHRFKNVAGAESDNEDRSSDNEEAAKPRSDSRFERADKEDDSDTDDDIVYRKDGKSSSLLMGKISKQKAKEAARGGNDEDEEEEEGEGAGSSLYPSKRRKPSMFQLKRGVDLDGLAANDQDGDGGTAKRKLAKKATLGERLTQMAESSQSSSVDNRPAPSGGDMIYMPKEAPTGKGRGIIIPHNERRDYVIRPDGMPAPDKKKRKSSSSSKGSRGGGSKGGGSRGGSSSRGGGGGRGGGGSRGGGRGKGRK